MRNPQVSSPEIARLNRMITFLNIAIFLSKAIPWIVTGLATWSLSLGILDVMAQNWVWVVINFALAFGGYSFAASIFRKGRKQRNIAQTYQRTPPTISRAAKDHAEAA